MQIQYPKVTQCLTHQLPEDQTSLIGLVCPRCKHRLYTQPPRGTFRSFWESQPMAYSLDGRPCFVYRLLWDDFHIRSLHAADCEVDDRRQVLRYDPREEAWFDQPRF